MEKLSEKSGIKQLLASLDVELNDGTQLKLKDLRNKYIIYTYTYMLCFYYEVSKIQMKTENESWTCAYTKATLRVSESV
jgi:hypothetical protein